MAEEDIPYDAAAQAENLPLYLFMLMYFLTTCGVAMIAKRWKEDAVKKGGEVAGHFGGEFNASLLVLTTFSSVFSGYTLMGLPTEANGQGFFATRWFDGPIAIAMFMVLYFPKQRRLAKARGYTSPNDFITDRYRSKILTVLGSLCTCMPQLVFLSVQLVSFAGLLNGLTVGAIPNVWGMLLCAVLMLALEKLGGMNSVVLTDAVQAVLMIFGFIAVFVLAGFKYGFLHDLAGADCPTYGIVNITAKEMFRQSGQFDEIPPRCDAVAEDCIAYGCLPAVIDSFVGNGKMTYFWWIFNHISYPLNPHMFQRAMIAKSDETVRTVIQSLSFAGFLTVFPGITVGIIVAVFSASWPLSSSDAAIIPAIQNELKKDGPFQYAMVAMLVCAALAAIMSTADSLLLGISNALTIDIYKGVLRPQATQKEVVNCSFAISVVFVGLSFILGLSIQGSQFGSLNTIQQGLLMQMVPAVLGGLFLDISTSALQSGLVAGLLCLPIVTWVVPNFAWGEPLFAMIPGPNICAFINLVVTVALQFAGVGQREEDEPADAFAESVQQRFGERINLTKINQYMEKDGQPSKLLGAIAFGLLILAFPWFFDITTTEVSEAFGWPVWSLYVIGFSVAAAAMNVAWIGTWRPAAMGSTDKMEMAALSRRFSEGLS